ncbi:hypothetical protein HNV11_19750 [Spirosoma taeanense]|uniref:Uncharacterized protein n=1 Tax=Spirosoma taeanense TaxID=2735870 RepID=A0A6M5YEP2_9BACT|nr:hypothetical protein [Spirosoma taeanense]QJW91452.1 hypothetical protein HNV11_19750 [Spirosoma taeanense]
MALDQHASNLITTTINAFNGDATSISPMDGISLIDSWISALRNSDQNSTDTVASGLSDLKAELQSGNPDGDHISELLRDLIDQVESAADSAETDVQTRLKALVEALQGFADQMSGSAGPARTGGQAPMTSTVGGESTTSGTGASAFGTNHDDDLSNRSTGGTVSTNDSAMGMDDTTGSDGGMSATTGSSSGMGEEEGESESGSAYGASSGDSGRPQDGGPYGSGYGTGSNGDDYSANSGTQRSGVSGGTADSGSGSSGGRSQY